MLKFICISPIHSLFNHILPFRIGEITLPFMLKTFANRRFGSGGVTLLMLRLYDLITVSIIFVLSFSVYFLGSMGSELYYIAVFILPLIAVAVAFLIITSLSKILQKIGGFLSSITRKMGNKGKIYSSKILDVTTETTNQIEKLSKSEKRIVLPIISLVIWISIYTFFYLLMRFLDINILYIKSTLASSGAIMSNILPINGLGSFGTLEGGWSLGYMIMGISKELAIVSGFIMHLIVIATLLLFSSIGFLYLLMNRKKENRALLRKNSA